MRCSTTRARDEALVSGDRKCANEGGAIRANVRQTAQLTAEDVVVQTKVREQRQHDHRQRVAPQLAKNSIVGSYGLSHARSGSGCALGSGRSVGHLMLRTGLESHRVGQVLLRVWELPTQQIRIGVH